MKLPNSPTQTIPHLIICGGANPVHFPLTGSIATVGRTEKNSIQIHRGNISFRHLEIRRMDDGRHRIFDLDSRNGTTVNGISIGSCVLRDGDCIVIGRLITAHYLLLPPGEGGVGSEPTEREMREFQTITGRLTFLAAQHQLLDRHLREKTAEYEELLDAIVELKRNPGGDAFRDIYGEGEVHFPVDFGGRITAPTDFLRGNPESEDVTLSS